MADNKSTTGSQSRGASRPIGAGNTGVDPERMIENAKDMGNQLIGAVRDSATSLLDEQRSRAADQIASVAGMVRDAVKSFDRESAGEIRRYADDTARSIDDFAEQLRNRSWGELADDVEDFARRWPMMFIASAIATGFIAGRFLVASGSRRTDPPAPMQTTPSTATASMNHEPRGGARYNYGAVSGPVSGSGKSGYGPAGSKETH